MHFLTSVSIGSRTKNQLSPTWISKIQLDLKQSTAHDVKVSTLFKTIFTMLDTAFTATTAHSTHSRYWSIKLCGTGRGRSRFDTTGTMIFADCPLCEKNIERNCAPWNFFIACVPFQKFYHCSSLAICVERKGKMAIRLYGPWSKNRWVDWGGFLFDC